MAMFKRNIWLLYAALFLLTSLSILWRVVDLYLEIESDFISRQKNRVELVESSLNSILLQHEMMLDAVSGEIVTIDFNQKKVSALPVFQRLLAMNPSLSVLALLDHEGNFIYVSGNADIETLQNLLEQEETADTYAYTLRTNKMVLGRTYYFKPIREHIIPARKRVVNEKGEVVAVMSVGLNLEGSSAFYNNQLHMSQFDQLDLIRDFDFFLQYRSSDKSAIRNEYAQPLHLSMVHDIFKHIEEKYGYSRERLKSEHQTVSFSHRNCIGGSQLVAMKYNTRYELWVSSSLDREAIWTMFLPQVGWILIFYVVSMLLFFILFRIIYRSEQKQQERLLYQATHDALTDLPNRNYLSENWDQWVKNGPFSVFFIDMDNFKHVNDAFGHQWGDTLLKMLTARLKEWGGQESLVIRIGGDEFLLLVPDSALESTDNVFLLSQAKLLINHLSEPFLIESFSFSLGTSVGIARYPQHGSDLRTLSRAADVAMYQSKKFRNTARIFSSDMDELYLRKVQIQHELKNGLVEDEIFMMYQPQSNEMSQIMGVEALVRWNSAELGFVNPQEFVSVAEDTGQMDGLGKFIIVSALKEISEVQKRVGRRVPVSINISVKQFFVRDFLEHLVLQVEENALHFSAITLEITENVFIEDMDTILPLFKKLHDIGIKISLDDFGTGYSSLSVLKKLPIDELKIDKSFIDTIVEDTQSFQMVKNIISIGKNLGMYIVAEGVETERQKEVLHRLGCDHIQGYLFSKPLKKEDLIEFLSQNA